MSSITRNTDPAESKFHSATELNLFAQGSTAISREDSAAIAERLAIAIAHMGQPTEVVHVIAEHRHDILCNKNRVGYIRYQ